MEEEGGFAITLGGKKFPLPPLMLFQLKRVCLALPTCGNGFTEVGFDSQTDIVYAGLLGAIPNLTPEAFSQMPMTRPELVQAADAVVVAAGFGTKKDDSSGEAQPGAAAEPTPAQAG